ncbi:MAG: 6-carboxytetrahydropterin synthase [Lentisphaeria bacterium]|nr:6-carboxytetrahydropterin synthase [Lentisphaeria bacterium]
MNDLAEFAECNPTSENIARIIYCELGKRLNDERVKVTKVSVEESPGSRASYFE